MKPAEYYPDCPRWIPGWSGCVVNAHLADKRNQELIDAIEKNEILKMDMRSFRIFGSLLLLTITGCQTTYYDARKSWSAQA